MNALKEDTRTTLSLIKQTNKGKTNKQTKKQHKTNLFGVISVPGKNVK